MPRAPVACRPSPGGWTETVCGRRHTAERRASRAERCLLAAASAAYARMGVVRALRKVAPGPGLELVDIPEPVCGEKDVKIRVLRAGLCGTDLHLSDYDDWAASAMQVPQTLGHEFFGEVVEVGVDV